MRSFIGAFDYNPPVNPLRNLSPAEKEEFAEAYMGMWVCQDCDDCSAAEEFNPLYEYGDHRKCAMWLVEAGAIDSNLCHPTCKEIEQIIESWAAKENWDA